MVWDSKDALLAHYKKNLVVKCSFLYANGSKKDVWYLALRFLRCFNTGNRIRLLLW